MPRFSIILPAYNNAEYLPRCLDSILAQSYGAWETVIVDDASPDDAWTVASGYAGRDERIHVVRHDENKGLHRTLKTAVAESVGDYCIFIDPDDLLPEGALEHLAAVCAATDADSIHFNHRVVPENDTPESECAALEAYLNKPYRTLEGGEIIAGAYDPMRGFERDWRLNQRALAGDVTRRAFAAMTDERLERAEDAYEFFVIASMLTKEVTTDVVAYEYHYGCGVTGFSGLTPERFSWTVDRFAKCIAAIDDYAASVGGDLLARCARGARAKLMDLLANDWLARVSDDDKLEAARVMAEGVGPADTATQLMRLARDASYAVWSSGGYLTGGEPFLAWADLARELAAGTDELPPVYRQLDATVRSTVEDLHAFDRMAEYDSQDVRIFVATHKRSERFDSAVLQPIHVGAAIAPGRIPGTLSDATGENISNLNPMYCELTALYWAWKNVDAEYLGFCHYRRYFDFNEGKRHFENGWGEIMAPRIDEAAQREYHLDDDSIRSAVRGYDVITTEFKDIRKYPDASNTPVDQYRNARLLHFGDFERIMRILAEMHPDYEPDIEAFLQGNTSCFCNMFILRKQVLDDFCSWMFPVLERFVAECDMTHYSREAVRTPGHLSERLFNIYYIHHMRVGAPWKTKQLQCVHFVNTDPSYTSLPYLAADTRGREVVPVAFAADSAYVPMLTTSIFSMLENASDAYHYDVVILHRDIDGRQQRAMTEFFARFPNATIRFFDVSSLIGRHKLTTNNPHISVETYYRFLIQSILPDYDKVLYLDSDLIIQGDVSELYRIDLADDLLAAAHDLDFLGNLNGADASRMDYAKRVLGMSDPFAYFQAGVLVLNTRAMRELHSIGEWLELASNEAYIYNDQDVLNAACEGRVRFLDFDWNVMTDCAGRVGTIFSLAPADAYKAYLDSVEHSKIVHYAGVEKPWNTSFCDRAELYWSYASETPFYEELLARRGGGGGVAPARRGPLPGKILADASPLRKIVDPLFPYDSRRREVVKSIAGRFKRG